MRIVNIIRFILSLNLFIFFFYFNLNPSAFASINSYTATNDNNNAYYNISYSGSYDFYRVYIDPDQNNNTGFKTAGIGASFLLENGELYSYTGNGSNWSWVVLKTVTYTNNSSTAKFTVARTDIGETVTPNATDLVFEVQSGSLIETSTKYTHTYNTTSNTTTINYTVDSTGIFPNPERGFIRYIGKCPLSGCNYTVAGLKNYRNDNISLVMYGIDLRPFMTANISQTALDNFNNDLSLIRQAGLKAIIRVAYSWSYPNSPQDTTKAWMLVHINQLKPVFQNNSDVIATVQGFIGAWGEGAYSDYFANILDGTISSTQWLDRQQVTEAILNAIPATRTIQLRTPAFKKHFFGELALTSNEAFTNTYRARTGHHNDCFLYDETDAGTYANITSDKAYLGQENLYVPQGGETCGISSYTSWSNANSEMRNLHYSFLSSEYDSDVVSSWGNNITTAKMNLGYRLSLLQGIYSKNTPINGNLLLSIQLKNTGYAAPYNPRKAEIILRNTINGSLYKFNLNTDPRRWTPSLIITINQNINLIGVPSGSYSLLLNLPDPTSTLYNRPEYSIRLANTNLWEATTGFNKLNHILTIQ